MRRSRSSTGHTSLPGRRIAVVGTTGSGKTTTARRLAAALKVPHVELDALYWQPEWTETPVEPFRRLVSEALSADGWVVDGNYGKVRDIVLARAESVVWLDFPSSRLCGGYRGERLAES